MSYIEDACKMLLQGKKVRMPGWENEQFYFYMKDNVVFYRNGPDHFETNYGNIDFFKNIYDKYPSIWVEYKEDQSSIGDLTSNDSELYSNHTSEEQSTSDKEHSKMSKVSITVEFDSLEEANSFMERGSSANVNSRKDMIRALAETVKSIAIYHEPTYKDIKIPLIKLARELFGFSLKEAKELVEEAAIGKY